MQLKFLSKLKSMNGKAEVPLVSSCSLLRPVLQALVEPGINLPPHPAVKRQIQEKCYNNNLTKCYHKLLFILIQGEYITSKSSGLYIHK